jgi:hypothetical protein
MSAREHCDGCTDCGRELELYADIARRLSALADPEVAPDFTASVLAAVQVREMHLVQRRHTLFAAAPAFALAALAIVGVGLSTQVDRVIDGITVLRTVVSVLTPVLSVIRVPLGVGAFVVFAAVLTALSRTLRPAPARAVES